MEKFIFVVGYRQVQSLSNWGCVLSPVVIDMDGRIYARPWQGGLLSGGFEKNPKPIFTEGRNQLEIQNMQEDWDHFGNRGSSLFLWTLHVKCQVLVSGPQNKKAVFWVNSPFLTYVVNKSDTSDPLSCQ